MNLALNGFTWRTVLRAVPEPSRPEILGTLTECYGPSAPLSEAFRTFTSGSRMHNRANASSPIDLWREAARNAVAFIMIALGITGVGIPLIPVRFSPHRPLWQPLFSAISIVVGFCLLRGWHLRHAGLVALATSCATVFLARSDSSSGTSRSIALTPKTGFLVLLFGTGLLLLARKSKPRLRVAIALASIAGGTTVMAIFRESQTGIDFSRFLTLTIAMNCVLLLALVGWIESATPAQSSRVWWPAALAVALGLLAVLFNANRFSRSVESIAGKLVAILLIGLVVTSIAMVFARPQLFLTIGFVMTQNVIQGLGFVNFRSSDWILMTAVPFAGAIGLGYFGTKRALNRF
jgi:hypothetical protein